MPLPLLVAMSVKGCASQESERGERESSIVQHWATHKQPPMATPTTLSDEASPMVAIWRHRAQQAKKKKKNNRQGG